MSLTTPKKILFIADHLKGGGAENMLLNLAEQLYDRCYEIHILTLLNINNYEKRTKNFTLHSADLSTQFVGGKLLVEKKLSTSEYAKLTSMINHIKPDAIIVTIWYSYLITPYISHENLWIWSQSDVLPEFGKTLNPIKFLRNIYKKIIFTRNFKQLFSHKNIITLNRDIEKKYKKLLDNINIHVVYNGLSNIDQFNISLNEKIWDICYVGRLSPSKQVEHAIIAFHQSQLKGRMVIVGDGMRKNKLLKLTKKLNLENRIVFIGWVEDPQKYIQQSKVLVLPSSTEGYPTVIGEALVNQTPVVAYKCTQGISHQLYTTDMQRGLVPTNDINALKNALEDVIHDPYHIPSNISERYSMDKMTQAFLKLID